MNRSTLLAIGQVLLMICCSGCAGGRMLVVADHIDYPVSATDSVYAPTGELLSIRNKRLRSVHHFSFDLRQWTLFWTLLAVTKEVRDISGQLQQEIEQHHGQGVVNLQVQGWLDPFWVATSLVPVLPSHFTAVVEGDVFQVVEAGR